MSSFNPYLNFAGNTEEAFNFYKSVFGGEFAMVMRFSDMPGGELPETDKNKIMHIALPIGNGNMLMATDTLESLGQTLTMGNNFYICVSPDNRDEAYRLFNAFAEGGKVEMPLADTFWGAYFGCVADKFGVQWMINFDKK